MLFNATTDEIRQAFVEANFDQPAFEIEDMFDDWLAHYVKQRMYLAWSEGASSSFLRPDLSIVEVFNRNPYTTEVDAEYETDLRENYLDLGKG